MIISTTFRVRRWTHKETFESTQFENRMKEFTDEVVGIVEQLEKEVLHWRSNHANLILRNQVLRYRLDLPFERTKIHKDVIALQAERDELRRKIEELMEERAQFLSK